MDKSNLIGKQYRRRYSADLHFVSVYEFSGSIFHYVYCSSVCDVDKCINPLGVCKSCSHNFNIII